MSRMQDLQFAAGWMAIYISRGASCPPKAMLCGGALQELSRRSERASRTPSLCPVRSSHREVALIVLAI